MPLQLRRGTDLQRQNMTEPLAAGELIYITDTGELYIGDGTTAGGNPIAQYTTATIKGLAAGVLTGGAHSGISFEYDSVSGTIDAVVDQDLSNYQGVIRASAFQGTLVADDSSILVDAIDGKIELDGTVKGNIVPDEDQTYDIGSSSARFNDIYLSGSSIFLGDATITATGTAINLPAGSTVGGTPIGSGSGTGDGVIEGSTYKINIAADDSTIIVNATTEVVTASGGFFGNLVGNVTGNVTGNLSGNVTGAVTGNVSGNVFGSLTGSVFGDLKGSVFADDSTVIIDGTEGSVSTRLISSPGNLVLNPSQEVVIQTTDKNVLKLESIVTTGLAGDVLEFDISAIRGTFDNPQPVNAGDFASQIRFSTYDGSTDQGSQLVSLIAQMDATADNTDSAPASNLLLSVSAGDGLGYGPYGDYHIFVFAKNGAFTAPVLQPRAFADAAERDAALTSPEAGMMIFVTDGDGSGNAKFQGYTGSAWVNLN